ncbi:MAG: flavodoxin family protein [Spirochaetia bacterium]|jgi:multimeric flavodoxin WrbA|nr:flavodoxin family protein [Spirochaetia bacterium]
MNLLIFNGSPRKDGNCSTAVRTITETVKSHITDATVIVLDTNEMDLRPCQDCKACFDNGGDCVFDDDTNEMINSVREADTILYVTPVYFWGVSAQLKLAVDKLYCISGPDGPKQAKKAGIISIGGASLEDMEYELISKQFGCIFDYIGWEKTVDLSFHASEKDDLAKDEKALSTLKSVWQKL